MQIKGFVIIYMYNLIKVA